MSSTPIRIRRETHQKLKQLAAEDHATLVDTLHRIVEDERRRRYGKAVSETGAPLKADVAAWAQWQAELTHLDATPADGLPDESEDES